MAEKGLSPLSPVGPGQPIEPARGDVMALLSDEAKALVIGELMDMRIAAHKAGAAEKVRTLDSAIRRVARGLYRYELRRVDPSAAPVIDFDVTQP